MPEKADQEALHLTGARTQHLAERRDCHFADAPSASL